MALTLISTSDLRSAQGHPLGFADIKNRAGRELAAILLAEHEPSGTHTTASEGIVIEAGTYTGDASGAMTISLNNSTLTPFLTLVFADTTEYPYMRLSNLTDTWSIEVGVGVGGSVQTGITGEGAGNFTVGSSLDTVQTYYYVVLGTESSVPSFTGDTGAGSDPTYIQHGEALLGGSAATMANSVEDTIYDIIDHEHTASTGIHDTDYVSWKYEMGTFVGDDSDNRTITLSNSNLDIKVLLMIGVEESGTYTARSHIRFESISGDDTKVFNDAVFAADYIQSMGTGTFQVGTKGNLDEPDFWAWLAIGTE